MNVLHIIPSMDPSSGGPSQVVRQLTQDLTKFNINNEIVCIDTPPADYLKADLFTIHALGPGKGVWQYSKKLIPWLIQNLYRFDAVIVNGLWLYHGYALQKSFEVYTKQKKRKPKLFVMPHGMLDPYFQKAKGRKLKAIRNWFYWKLIENRLINSADGLLFTCEEELNLARQSFQPYYPNKELNVGIGVARPPEFTSEMNNAFKKKCTGIREREQYILFLGRIHVKKGIELLINAYLSLKKQGYNLPKLVIAGPGTETTYGKYVQQLATTDSNILFPGMLIGDAKWGAFYGCEIFILPSHQENFGIAIVEALSCSKPVLVSKQVNISHEIVVNGGGIVGDDSIKGTKKMLETWYNLNDDARNKMKRNAKETFINNFSVESTNTKFITAIS